MMIIWWASLGILGRFWEASEVQRSKEGTRKIRRVSVRSTSLRSVALPPDSCSRSWRGWGNLRHDAKRSKRHLFSSGWYDIYDSYDMWCYVCVYIYTNIRLVILQNIDAVLKSKRLFRSLHQWIIVHDISDGMMSPSFGCHFVAFVGLLVVRILLWSLCHQNLCVFLRMIRTFLSQIISSDGAFFPRLPSLFELVRWRPKNGSMTCI